jgi:hypothetical protein
MGYYQVDKHIHIIEVKEKREGSRKNIWGNNDQNFPNLKKTRIYTCRKRLEAQ